MPEPEQSYRRDETTAASAGRRYSELLQELRVTQTGIQVLLGFLFTVVFSNRFPDLTGTQQAIYLTTLVLGASATALLIAPVSFHRILFSLHVKSELVRAANRLTMRGPGLLMCTITGAMLLVSGIMLKGPVVVWCRSRRHVVCAAVVGRSAMATLAPHPRA
jgi:hypothetical protein